MIKISKARAKDLIKAAGGKIFTASNIKKDGTKRILNGRTEVHKGVTGVGMGYNPEDYNMITIFDMQKKEFRTLNLETLYGLKINHEEYEVA